MRHTLPLNSSKKRKLFVFMKTLIDVHRTFKHRYKNIYVRICIYKCILCLYLELGGISPESGIPRVISGFCIENWTPYKGKCYHIGNQLLSFSKAQEYCKTLNASLVAVHSKTTNNFLGSLLLKNNVGWVWLNAKQADEGSSQFQWIDGSDFNYTGWISGFPEKPKQNYSDCVYLSDQNGWVTQQLHKNKSVYSPTFSFGFEISKKKQECTQYYLEYYRNPKIHDGSCLHELQRKINKLIDVLNGTQAVDKNLDEKRLKNGNKTYEIFAEKLNFNDAKQKGGSLLEIRDEMENKFISQHLLFDKRYWIGAKRFMLHSSLFLYTNGKKMKYANWPAAEPKPTEMDNCVNIKNGKMHVDICDELFQFICEFENYGTKSSGNVVIEDVMRENHRLSKELNETKLLTNTQSQIMRILLQRS
ncbi:macrophage mannose receptor 1-like isoform X2 [Leptotrombidium deliense]|uniref:Macrophage mannose receptor 1-like isoform X2 n=1 Tax=Leptotrombidium deliense TaxID=299467 RepID=A0A443SH78_9ACAR|nr:macrophage mannose receptor 1-like isoform X2 [Leptotrombidium deliense]